MGISTVGFVATENKNVCDICYDIETNLREYLYKKYNQTHEKVNTLVRFSKCSPTWTAQFATKSFYCGFSLFCKNVDGNPVEENRHLSVHFGCDTDYKDVYEGPKVIFTLGCWGHAVDLINVVGQTLSKYGTFYSNENDCTEGWVKHDGQNTNTRNQETATARGNARRSRKRKEHAGEGVGQNS